MNLNVASSVGNAAKNQSSCVQYQLISFTAERSVLLSAVRHLFTHPSSVEFWGCFWSVATVKIKKTKIQTLS